MPALVAPFQVAHTPGFFRRLASLRPTGLQTLPSLGNRSFNRPFPAVTTRLGSPPAGPHRPRPRYDPACPDRGEEPLPPLGGRRGPLPGPRRVGHSVGENVRGKSEEVEFLPVDGVCGWLLPEPSRRRQTPESPCSGGQNQRAADRLVTSTTHPATRRPRRPACWGVLRW